MGTSPEDSAPRIAPVVDPTPEQEEVLAKTLLPGGEPLRIFTTMAHHVRLLKRFNALGGLFLTKGLVPAREREIVILRTGWRCGSVYEFGQHTLIGERAGLHDDEIRALSRPVENGEWSADDRLLVTMADELCDGDDVTDETWSGLRARWDEDQMIELVVLVGFYRMVSGFLNAVRVQPEPGLPGWPS